MSTYAIGDVQGCYRTLMALLDRVEFAPPRDRLWLVGDLVNRGPSSRDVLRWAAKQSDSTLTAVLGNHDLYLLARVLADARRKSRDSLSDVMESRDRDDLIEWLRHRPLAHSEADCLMVHAGVHPDWECSRVIALAREAENVLRGPAAVAFLGSKSYSSPPSWSDDLGGPDRIASIVGHLTRLRTFDSKGVPDWDFTGHPTDGKGHVAWFAIPERKTRELTVVFGHWASLGLHRTAGIEGLDSGCVYGRSLTALRLDDGTIVQERCVDSVG